MALIYWLINVGMVSSAAQLLTNTRACEGEGMMDGRSSSHIRERRELFKEGHGSNCDSYFGIR